MSTQFIEVKDRIDSARSPNEVSIMGVTKGRMQDEIHALREAGCTLFGENKVQEAQEKWHDVERSGIELHMIGHLQTNKVSDAVALFDVIQSVDSLKVLQKLYDEALKQEKIMRVFIQVNISRDPEKYGIAPDEVLHFFREATEILVSDHIRVEGLMAITEHTENPEYRRPAFREMKRIFDDLREIIQPGHIENIAMKHLSMGMSEDFEIAIEEGSTMVRLGRVLFT